ncbi:hypothetical protein SEUCBS139899_006181 [Sporothrix eucalyptigena]|uniref:Mitochondrial ribosomal protein n=1 Tax=Sporothrix eucalyptigena TaxID=1812306 RepID=A0ABP0AQH5_9PEZI
MSVAGPLTCRPLRCCFQAATRQAWRRFASTTTTASTATNPSPATAVAAMPTRFQTIVDKSDRVRTAFAVYSPPPRTTKQASLLPQYTSATPSTPSSSASTAETSKEPKVDVIHAYDQQQIARMDPTGARTRLFSRKNPDSARPGDVLLVTPSKAGTEAFAGVCLAIRRSGIETAILLRGQLAKTGVEMWFKIYSRSVAAIDIIERRVRRARRAKLTYMRQAKHDRGSVEDVVKSWRRSRNIMRTKVGPGAGKAGGKGQQKGKR